MEELSAEMRQMVRQEIREQLDEYRERMQLLLYKQTVVTEVCYAARRRNPDTAPMVAVDAVLAMDWPDEWWQVRMKKETPGNGAQTKQLSVLEWIGDISVKAAALRAEGVWR